VKDWENDYRSKEFQFARIKENNNAMMNQQEINHKFGSKMKYKEILDKQVEFK
jgi:hypothetical protein